MPDRPSSAPYAAKPSRLSGQALAAKAPVKVTCGVGGCTFSWEAPLSVVVPLRNRHRAVVHPDFKPKRPRHPDHYRPSLPGSRPLDATELVTKELVQELYRFARGLVERSYGLPDEWYEDLLQETLWRAWKGYLPLRGEFRAYCCGIAKNLARNEVRKEARRLEREKRAAVLSIAPYEWNRTDAVREQFLYDIADEFADLTDRAGLAEREATMLWLEFGEEFTSCEVAGAIGASAVSIQKGRPSHHVPDTHVEPA